MKEFTEVFTINKTKPFQEEVSSPNQLKPLYVKGKVSQWAVSISWKYSGKFASVTNKIPLSRFTKHASFS